MLQFVRHPVSFLTQVPSLISLLSVVPNPLSPYVLCPLSSVRCSPPLFTVLYPLSLVSITACLYQISGVRDRADDGAIQPDAMYSHFLDAMATTSVLPLETIAQVLHQQ